MRHIVTTAMLGALLVATGHMARAQNPSADDIIKSLRPSAPSGLTRGIRPVAPGPEPAPASPAPSMGTATVHPAVPAASRAPRAPGTTPAAPATAAPSVQAAARAPSVDLTVQFKNGSSELTPAAMHTLDELGRALTSEALAAYRFRIEGHTDTVGSRDLNKMLSDQRAAAVLQYLADKWHVDRERVQTIGMGEDQLLVPTGPNVPEPRNRRVTVVNIGT